MDPVVWTFFIIVVAVCLVLAVVLKYLSGVVADRKTRKIITEGMAEDGGESENEESSKTEN